MILEKDSYTRSSGKYTVAEAFAAQVERNEHWGHSGELESMRDKTNELVKLTGTFIELLNKKGLLTNAEVLSVLDDFKEVKGE